MVADPRQRAELANLRELMEAFGQEEAGPHSPEMAVETGLALADIAAVALDRADALEASR